MIKILKLSNKSVRRFTTNKEWNYTTQDDNDSIMLEQGNDIPIFINSESSLATEQNKNEFNLNVKYGKNVKGTFFSKDSKYFDEKKEPVNYDGSYQRVVYNSMKHLFYNEYGMSGNSKYDYQYKNPLNVFGGESGKYTTLDFKTDGLDQNDNGERRILKDDVMVLEIPSEVFGEKVKPNSFKIKDYSSLYDTIEIADDGNTNLVVQTGTFNEISEIHLNESKLDINLDSHNSGRLNINYNDLTYGYSISSFEKYYISGSPVLENSPSELQSGRASLHKYNESTKQFELLRDFYCPFTQNGISSETGNDNCEFILTELGNIVTSENSLINDSFGKSVELKDDICAIGSPTSHITGRNNDQPTGHIFVYDKNKGGLDNWGIVNVFEGDPDSEFGASISIDGDYLVVGSPNLHEGNGGVYIFKKTKRTKSHPWIKTSCIYDSYQWNDVLKKYEGIPKKEDQKYVDFLKKREVIVSKKILNHRETLLQKKQNGEISEKEYQDNLTTSDDYSQVYPFNFLYSTGEDCENIENLWYKHKFWNKNTHASVRCKISEDNNYYQKAVWPGYITDERDGSYIPNPDHEQNKQNRWAYRWKLENVSGNNTPLVLFDEETNNCDQDSIEMFSGSNLNSFGDSSKYPMNEYSESPDSSLGDTTFDLIGIVLPPSKSVKRFGEKVKIKSNNLYISNPSSSLPRCYSYLKEKNEFGCEVWNLTNTLSNIDLMGHSNNKPLLSESINSLSINYYDSYLELEICPAIENYASWVWKTDSNVIDVNQSSNTKTIIGGNKVSKCDSICTNGINYNFYARYDKINDKSVGQIPANYGEVKNLKFKDTNGNEVNLTNLISPRDRFLNQHDDYVNRSVEQNPRFYSKSNLATSFQKIDNENQESIGLSWKNFRENLSFVYPNVKSGSKPSFMTIYSNDAVKINGKYDPIHTIAEIGAQNTLNNKLVRLIFNTGLGESEFYYEFLFNGSVEGKHFKINELVNQNDFLYELPHNFGNFKDISDLNFIDSFLNNKGNAKFYSKGKNDLSYIDSNAESDSLALSWKNFRENVSFSYQLVNESKIKNGTVPSFMSIYSPDAKEYDGSYNPLKLLAEIGASDTLNGHQVRLTFNKGSANDEFYYDFIYKGSEKGTHVTINELVNNIQYECTLPPNSGNMKIVKSKSGDIRFFSKDDQIGYHEPNKPVDTAKINWKNFRENTSFSYPAVKESEKQIIMSIYSNDAKKENGDYDSDKLLAEIQTSENLNGKKVRLTLNVGFVGGDEYFYEFIFKGSKLGNKFTLNELRKDYEGFLEMPSNLGIIRHIPDFQNKNIFKRCRIPKFYTKGKYDASYIDPFGDENSIGLSWKNFRENVSFWYKPVPAGDTPAFMSIYSNSGKLSNGNYDPLHLLAEIGASSTLNDTTVRLMINADNCDRDKTIYYEFKYKGSIEGTHFTLNELRTKYDFDCTLNSNKGTPIDISEINFDDGLLEPDTATFYSKPINEPSYIEPNTKKDTIRLSWKNFRENVSFSYPAVKEGNTPSFMTIYSNKGKNLDGTYDPIYCVAEIGGHDTLNGKLVRLTFNSQSQNEFYYEFSFDGSIEGKHFTLNELIEKEDKNTKIKYESYQSKKSKLNFVKKHYSEKPKLKRKDVLSKIKSFGCLPPNSGKSKGLFKIKDDFLGSTEPKFYSSEGEHFQANSLLENEIEIHWKNLRENVSFHYPNIVKHGNLCTMKIYANNFKLIDGTNLNDGGRSDQIYIPEFLLAEITTSESLNGEVVRLTFNTNKDDELFYEFIFDGTVEGTKYTLDQLLTKPSERLGKPLLVHSPEFENCKVRIEKDSLQPGYHKLYVALVDENNSAIDSESVIEFHVNPTIYNVIPRQLQINKSFNYNEVQSKFGTSIDATANNLIIGDPSDRKYYPLNDDRKEYIAGSAFVYNIDEQGRLQFMEKLYGEEESELYFNSRFGNDVSIIGDNFLIGSYSDEFSNIELVETGTQKRLEIEDFNYGPLKFDDDTFNTVDALITNYEYDLNSEYGDAVLKIKIGTLNIDFNKLSEIYVRADFIDTGRNTIRIEGVRGQNLDTVNGTYKIMENPISVKDGCEIEDESDKNVYINKNKWSIYWDTKRDNWVLTDTPNVSYEYKETFTWLVILKNLDSTGGFDEYDILTENNLNKIFELYEISDLQYKNKWLEKIQNIYPENKILFIDLILELESIGRLKPTVDNVSKLFNLYRIHSIKRIEPEVEAKWLGSIENVTSILPIIYELNSINPIFINSEILRQTVLEIYNLSDGDIMTSWHKRLGYNYTLIDILNEVRPQYYDKINLRNLSILFKIFNIQSTNLIEKWESKIGLGYLLCDVYAEITKTISINFSMSLQSSYEDIPTRFVNGFGTLENNEINVTSNNDTTGTNGSLTWGIYRDKTEIVGSYVYVYVNILEEVSFTDTIVFLYNSVKNAINGYAYYYNINNNNCNKIKRVKTNKMKYGCRKQYGHSVSLSKDFIFIGSPVLGNFNINNLITFGGKSVVSFGSSDKMYLEYESIHPRNISKLNKNTVGSVLAYDHSALRDNKKYYLGNIFYKNGIVSLTDKTGYFSDLLTNSGSSGFEMKFKSTQTLYENEILCRVEPHEFNFSTNPTSLETGQITFDVNEDGVFDIKDASYIFKYIMGGLSIDNENQDIIDEQHKSIVVGENSRNWPAQDIILTESEDVILMDLFMNSNTNTTGIDIGKILNNCKNLLEQGHFDIDGDGITSAKDAKLLLRYFLGRTGQQLTNGLVDRFGEATRFLASDIVEYLNEKTGKNIGRKINTEFNNYEENDKNDTLGSYLAPYATTIGLYSGLELVMIAKLGKPIKILPNYPINFLIKFDS